MKLNLKEIYTFLKEVNTFLIVAIAGAAGWFVTDGVYLITEHFHGEKIDITPLGRFWSACFGAMMAFFVRILLWFKKELNDALIQTTQAVRDTVDVSIKSGIDESVIPKILSLSIENSDIQKEIGQSVGPIIRAIASKNPSLAIANSSSVKSFVDIVLNKMNQLNTVGVEVNLNVHMQTTRDLVKRSESYIQIQRNIFDVNDEWTGEWKRFLLELAKSDIARIYILLVNKSELSQNKGKVVKIKMFLDQVGFVLKFYDLSNLKDSFGSDYLQYDAIEVFSEMVVKTQELDGGNYTGGKSLKMALFEYNEDLNLTKMVRDIVNNSRVVNLDSI